MPTHVLMTWPTANKRNSLFEPNATVSLDVSDTY